MAEHPNDRERATDRERSTHTRDRSSSTGIAAVVGGLVVAVLVIFWLFGGVFDGGGEVAETAVTVEETDTAAGAGGETVGTGTEAEMAPEGDLGAASEGEIEVAPEAEGEAAPAAEEPATAN